jgi:hypothetical protein
MTALLDRKSDWRGRKAQLRSTGNGLMAGMVVMVLGEVEDVKRSH